MSVLVDASRALAVPDPLRFRRQRIAPGETAPISLGGRVVGRGAAALQAALLAPADAVDVLDAWITAGVVEERLHGCVRYATDGVWLHGVAEVDDRAGGGTQGLQAASQRAYADLFEVLASHSCPHLLRLWNYLADINLETDGSERYRQFNTGRQQAFIDARRSAFEGSPAACALGTRAGPLQVYFLAGRQAPLAIENPRQTSAYRYPHAYGPRSPTFSRAALVDAGGGSQALFISGTASIVGHETVHVGDVRAQTAESLLNIDTVRRLAAAHAGVAFPAGSLVYTVYLRHPADLAVVREVFENAVGATTPAAREAVYLQADICRADLLVEIEAHGFVRMGEIA